jgi:hypothetical protein
MSYVSFDVDSIDWDKFLNVQEGGQSTNYFVGQRYMRGYGVLGSIGKFLLPIAKNLASTVGNEGVAAGTRILKDVTEGKEFGEAIKEHSKKGFENLSEKIKQCGKGKKPRLKNNTIKNPNYTSYTPSRSRSRWGTTPRGTTPTPKTASPTIVSKALLKRKRKPDQLDIF